MSNDSRVDELLEQLLDSGGTPEEVCQSCPELLAPVRAGWQQLRALQAEVGELFPEFTSVGGANANVIEPHGQPHPELPRVSGYEVQEMLGRGGMGIVYKAWHLRLNRPVALKMLLGGVYAQPEELERFLREAETVAGLRHPNIVQVHEAGDVDGRPYFTMEFIEGGTLAQKLAGTPQPARQAAALVAVVGQAVHTAHQGGIVHRDLKPGNILLTADGTPKLTDFGLARRLKGTAGLTQSGAPLGTPSYMAPEQAEGKARAVGPAADIYALGAILYELLTGRPPFRAETAAQTLQQVISQDPVPPSRLNATVPRDLETICLKCLEKDSAQRYPSALAVAEDLHRFQRNEPIVARPVGPLERAVRWTRRKPTAAALVATALALVALALGGLAWFEKEQARRRAELRDEVDSTVTHALNLSNGSHFREARELLEEARKRLEPAGPDDLRRQLDQARTNLQLAENLDRASQQTILLGLALRAQGRHDEAIRQYQEAIRLNPKGSASVHINLGNALLDQGRLDEAAFHYKECIRLEPRASAMAHYNLANVLRLKGRLDEAIDHLQESIRLDPMSAALAHNNLGNTLLAKGRLEEAAIHYKETIRLDPRASATAHHNLANVLRLKGRTDEAIELLQESIRLDPKSAAMAHHTLGLVLQDNGRLDEAIGHFQQAVQFDRAPFGASNALFNCLFAAACAAVQASDSQETRLGEQERAGLRRKALERLRAGLELRTKLLKDGKVGWVSLLSPWQTDPTLASLRDRAALAKLPDAERQQWERLWGDVAALVVADPLEQGMAHAARRDWAKAADCYTHILVRDTADEGHLVFEYAALLLLSGDRPGYSNACARMVVRCGKVSDLRAYHMARACTLAPDAVAE
ncbi:MAG TPA: serine/threonine-protein kinase, partial [Gemmataceae bacterium]|nr:serine/threonine-protein kinase [Gemmataceae bacterium]